ncbi:glycosyltransferase [Thermoanaerobacterium thermosaccharolyticum]
MIVVDDFSSDKTAEIAKSYGVKVLKNTEHLKSGQERRLFRIRYMGEKKN